jgi:hypothetical protein
LQLLKEEVQLVLDFGLPQSGEKRVTLRKFLLGKHRDAGDFLNGGLFVVTLILGTVLGRTLKKFDFFDKFFSGIFFTCSGVFFLAKQ